MQIEKIYSEIDSQEKLFSVLMTEEEYNLYSKYADEDYLEERRKTQKYAKPLGTALGAGLGALYGTAGGGKGALIGAGVGGGAGYLLGRHAKKRAKKEEDRYRKASKEDREYLRHKEEKEKDREAMINAGIWAGR